MFEELKRASGELDRLRGVVPAKDDSLTSSASTVSEHSPAGKSGEWTLSGMAEGAYRAFAETSAKILPSSLFDDADTTTMSPDSVVRAKQILGTRVAKKLKQFDAKLWREITSWSPRYRNLIGSDLVDHIDRAMDSAIVVSELRGKITAFIAEAAPSSKSELEEATKEVNEITEELSGFEETCPKVFESVVSRNPLPIPTAGFALSGPKVFISRLIDIANTIRHRDQVDVANLGFRGLARTHLSEQQAKGKLTNINAPLEREDIPRIRENVRAKETEFLENLEKLARKTWSEVKGGSYSREDANRVKAATNLLRSIGTVHKIVKEIVTEDVSSGDGANIETLLQETTDMFSHADILFHETN